MIYGRVGGSGGGMGSRQGGWPFWGCITCLGMFSPLSRLTLPDLGLDCCLSCSCWGAVQPVTWGRVCSSADGPVLGQCPRKEVVFHQQEVLLEKYFTSTLYLTALKGMGITASKNLKGKGTQERSREGKLLLWLMSLDGSYKKSVEVDRFLKLDCTDILVKSPWYLEKDFEKQLQALVEVIFGIFFLTLEKIRSFKALLNQHFCTFIPWAVASR